MKKIMIPVIFAALSAGAFAQKKVTPVRYGDFNTWVTREIHESPLLGGGHKKVYEVGPEKTVTGNVPYTNLDGSPWATSNVYAKVSGIVKASNAVYPHTRSGHDRCAKLCTQIETIKVLGMLNMHVMVAGSLFLGEMIEPVTSTGDPYTKMEMGMPFTGRPEALVLDVKVDMPATDTRVKASGFGARKTLPGRDQAVVFIILQKRWEDADGTLHAARVATGGELFSNGFDWKNAHTIPLVYGKEGAKTHGWLPLRDGKNAYYARNSKGNLVPVHEATWADPGTRPTHAIVMMSSGNGEPFIGTEGLTLYVDNVGFVY